MSTGVPNAYVAKVRAARVQCALETADGFASASARRQCKRDASSRATQVLRKDGLMYFVRACQMGSVKADALGGMQLVSKLVRSDVALAPAGGRG